MRNRHFTLESLGRGSGELSRAALVILAAVLVAAVANPASGQSPGPVARSPAAAGVEPLESHQRRRRAERRNKEIDLAIETLALKQGDAVAEIGAGDARFSVRFAEAVGPQGRVYANELGASKVRRIQERARRLELANLTAVEGAVDDTKLPDECCDAVMMRMVYHMLTHPEPMARSVYRALRPGGRLLILEGDPKTGRPNAPGVPENRAGMGIDPEIVIDELSTAGFQLERRIPDWIGADYGLVFRKPRIDVQPSRARPEDRSGPTGVQHPDGKRELVNAPGPPVACDVLPEIGPSTALTGERAQRPTSPCGASASSPAHRPSMGRRRIRLPEAA